MQHISEWKIIGCSNFDNESVSDFLVCSNITNSAMANDLLEIIKDRHEAGWSTHFYKLVSQDYELYEYNP